MDLHLVLIQTIWGAKHTIYRAHFRMSYLETNNTINRTTNYIQSHHGMDGIAERNMIEVVVSLWIKWHVNKEVQSESRGHSARGGGKYYSIHLIAIRNHYIDNARQPPEDHHDTLRHPFFSSDELDNEANETHKSRSQQPGNWMIRPHKTHPTQSQDHPSYTNIRSTTTCHQSYQ
eukprot:289342_1